MKADATLIIQQLTSQVLIYQRSLPVWFQQRQMNTLRSVGMLFKTECQ